MIEIRLSKKSLVAGLVACALPLLGACAGGSGAENASAPIASESVQEPAVAEIQEAMAAETAAQAATMPDPTGQALESLTTRVDDLTLEVDRLKWQVLRLQAD
jgi:hypothetical protein